MLAFLGLKRRIEKTAENGSYTIRKMWPHYLAIALFLLGMLWHAALFKLSAEITRSTAVSGNEGWYLDVLVGSVFTILIVLAVSKLKKSHILPILGCSVGFMVVWNLTARLVMDMFWTGQVRLVTFMRSVVWQDVLSALFHPESWQNWFSLPGVIQPVAISGGLTLGIALVMSAFLTIRFAGHRTLSAIACVPGNSER